MSIVRLDHVQLAMPSGREAEAVAFYDGLLGIPNIPKPPHLAVRGGCWFETDAVKVHLGVDPDFRPARKAHAALIVDDLDTLIATLTAAGHIPRDDEPLEGYHRVYVDDPFGNRLELMQPATEGINQRRVRGPRSQPHTGTSPRSGSRAPFRH